MAAVDAIDTVKLLIKIANTASPPVYTHPCLINSERGYTRTAETKANVIPECITPEDPGEVQRATVSLDSEISGAGMLSEAAAKAYNDMVGQIVNIKVQVGSATGALVVTGPYILESFSVTGSGKGDMVTCAVKFVQASAPTSSALA